jgi:hypothetical protein
MAAMGAWAGIAIEDVVDVVRQPAPAESRPVGTALRGMVVDNVEDNLDACGVERFDHGSKLVEHAKRLLGRTISGMGRGGGLSPSQSYLVSAIDQPPETGPG